jgi:hypothetical protein
MLRDLVLRRRNNVFQISSQASEALRPRKSPCQCLDRGQGPIRRGRCIDRLHPRRHRLRAAQRAESAQAGENLRRLARPKRVRAKGVSLVSKWPRDCSHLRSDGVGAGAAARRVPWSSQPAHMTRYLPLRLSTPTGLLRAEAVSSVETAGLGPSAVIRRHSILAPLLLPAGISNDKLLRTWDKYLKVGCDRLIFALLVPRETGALTRKVIYAVAV